MTQHLDAIKTQIAAIDAEISAQIANGASYSISGSHSKTGVALAELRREKSRLIKEFNAALGLPSRSGAVAVPRYS